MSGQSKTGTTLLMALLLAAIVGAAAWFFAISPQLDERNLADEAAVREQDENERLELMILQAQSRAQDVPEWRREIALISLDLPPLPEQANLHRLVIGKLEQYDLPVVNVSYGSPTPILVLFEEPEPEQPATEDPTVEGEAATEEPAPPAEEPAPAEPETEDAETDEGVPSRPTPEGEVEGLIGIPVSIETEGSLTDAFSFFKDIQVQTDRFFTITGFTINRADAQEAEPGRRALTQEDVIITVSGYFFSLIDDELSFPIDADGEWDGYVIGTDPRSAFVPPPGTEESADG